MAQGIKVTVKPTWADIRTRFARANKKRLDSQRNELQSEGRQISDLIIRRLQAKIGRSKIERGIDTSVKQVGQGTQLKVTVPGRARPHRIEARNAQALAFFWPRAGMQVFVPRRGGFPTHVRGGNLWIGKGGVDHPGGSLVPLMEPILQDAANHWQRSRGRTVLGRIASSYTLELTK